MADQDQLAILKKGVEVWNNWRRLNPDEKVDLSGADLRYFDLEGIDFSGGLLNHTNLAHANLKKANFTSAQLADACLAFANLEDAVLAFAQLFRADLRAANLNGASLEDTNLEDANLSHASLARASFAYAQLRNSNLAEADLSGVNFCSANLDNVNIGRVTFDNKIFLKILKAERFHPKRVLNRKYDLILDTTMRCKGVHAATCYGSQRFKLFLQDQDYLEEFLETSWGKRICFFWWLTADCGRSLARWTGWSIVIAMIFALAYYLLGSTHYRSVNLEFNVSNMIYYSVVTFTTLGFGDITPCTTFAAMLVMCEVIIGYMMLGGLITIFASKLSRRGA